jgi:peptidoglycan hydrolase-like protein with peptidoglycan-binding domain
MSSGSDHGSTGMSSHRGMAMDRSGHAGSSAQIREAQEQLKAQGHDPGPIDGMMGPRTQQALRDFQKDQNITASGRLDDQTRQKLGLAAGSGSTQPGSQSGSQK